jgi:outer membrane protein assembly factor BamE (lipoprotein component of BamABCDE complex)
MKNSRTGLLAVMFALLLSGCVIAIGGEEFRDDSNRWRERAESNKQHIHELRPGAHMDSVVATMGRPDISEVFVRDGKTYRVYYYRTRQVHSDRTTTKDEATPLVFVDDQLVGWGDTAIQFATAR